MLRKNRNLTQGAEDKQPINRPRLAFRTTARRQDAVIARTSTSYITCTEKKRTTLTWCPLKHAIMTALYVLASGTSPALKRLSKSFSAICHSPQLALLFGVPQARAVCRVQVLRKGKCVGRLVPLSVFQTNGAPKQANMLLSSTKLREVPQGQQASRVTKNPTFA